MRTRLFFNLLLACGLASSVIHAETKLQGDPMDDYSVFNDLSKDEALKKGREMAQDDFAKGVYRLLVVGKRPVESAYDGHLKIQYGVIVTPIAGCIVSTGIMGGEQGYNLTMKPLLNRKFGHDIFEDAERVEIG